MAIKPLGVSFRLPQRFAPPLSLGDRIRWMFLLFGLLNLAGATTRHLVGATDTSAPARAAAVVSLLLLGVWWVAGYRRRQFPVWGVPLEAVAFYFVGLGFGDWVSVVGLLFVAVSFRGLFGGWQHVLAITAALFVAGAAAVARGEPTFLPEYLRQASGVPPLALFTAVVAVSTGRQERASHRERVFSRVGTMLVTTSDRDVILQTLASAAQQMLGQVPGPWAVVGVARAGAQILAAAAGTPPCTISAQSMALTPMPAGIAAIFDQGRAVYLAGSDYSETAGTTMLISLRTEKQSYGTLLVGSDKTLPDELARSLEALAGQTTLGLVNAEFAADLRHQAFHDSLTGLPNRALLREHLSHALARARRGSPLAVLLIDLDGFKQVNDTYGHATGDHLLRTVGQRLFDGIRGADTAARVGGDEFAVILDGMDSVDDTLPVARRLLDELQAPIYIGGVELRPLASFGVATWRGHKQIDHLLHDADSAMYAAKSAGQGRLSFLSASGDAILMPVRELSAGGMPVIG